MSQRYIPSSAVFLRGAEPARRRPSMSARMSRPDHLAQLLVDRSVDEAVAGRCNRIDVTLFRDGSLEVADDGTRLPVEIDPSQDVSGVELMLTRLPGNRLPPVGLSVVNALSRRLDCWVWHGGKEYSISFRDSKLHAPFAPTGRKDPRKTGTKMRFWPDPRFFDRDRLSVPQLKRMLEAKAVLCPGLRVSFTQEETAEESEWFVSP